MTALPPALRDRIHLYPDRAAWLAARRENYRIGGSDVASILGVDGAFGSPWTVYLEKVHGIEAERAATEQRTLRWGQVFEPAIIAWYAEETRRQPIDTQGHLLHIRHPDEDWIAPSPDGLTWDPSINQLGGLEVKDSEWPDDWGATATHIERWTDGCENLLPPRVALQAYWGLQASGLDWWDVGVKLPRRQFRWFRLYQCPPMQSQIVDLVGEFRDSCLVQGREPQVDDTAEIKRWITKRFPGDASKQARPANGEESAKLIELAAVKRERKRLEAREGTLAHELGLAMGDTYKIKVPGTGLSAIHMLPQTQHRIDTTRLADERPDIAREFAKTTAVARFIRVYDKE